MADNSKIEWTTQYYGEPALIYDPRPSTWTKRGVSSEDDPARVAWIDELERRYRKDKE